MIIQRALIQDIPAMMQIRESVGENKLPSSAVIFPQDYQSQITGNGRGWICKVDNEITGFAIIDLRHHNLWAHFVHPVFQGIGIGKLLYKVALSWYFKISQEKIWLTTNPGTRASTFYNKRGWEKAASLPDGSVKLELLYQ
jgi:GNAT superfamily N-acetyltransferase